VCACGVCVCGVCVCGVCVCGVFVCVCVCVCAVQQMSLEFFIDIILPIALWLPGVDSASNRNEYQEHFLGVKAAGA